MPIIQCYAWIVWYGAEEKGGIIEVSDSVNKQFNMFIQPISRVIFGQS
jgi:hypothetical protein